MNDLRRTMAGLDDEELAAELRALSGWLDAPSLATTPAAVDPARLARLRIEAARASSRPRLPWWPWRRIAGGPVRRSLVLAVIVLIVVAAIATAIGLGVPGIRLIFVGPSPSPSIVPRSSVTASGSPPPSPFESSSPSIAGPAGSGLDLGIPIAATQAPALAGFDVLAPTDPSIGPPDAIWLREGRLTLVWRSRPGLPDTPTVGIGLLLTEFRGRTDDMTFGKMIGPGTTVTPVTVGGFGGFWISGELHELVYLDDQGRVTGDGRETVGDTLIWTRGAMTFRLETSLGRDAAIRMAETIR